MEQIETFDKDKTVIFEILKEIIDEFRRIGLDQFVNRLEDEFKATDNPDELKEVILKSIKEMRKEILNTPHFINIVKDLREIFFESIKE